MNDSTGDADESDYATYLAEPYDHLDEAQRRWLRPLGPLERTLRWVLFRMNRMLMRSLFRVEARGLDHLPSSSPYLFCPNHTSSLDPAAIVAVLDESIVKRSARAGRKGAVLRSPWRRLANRLAGTIPIDRDLTALAVAAAVLQRGENLVWFPEGTRTNDGELQEFKPGIGMLLYHVRIAAVPVYISGAYEAWPPTARFPRKLSKIVVHFGKPLEPLDVLADDAIEEQAIDKLVMELRRRVAELAPRR